MKIHHVAISVSSMDSSIEWYRRHLGFGDPAFHTSSDRQLDMALLSNVHGDHIELFAHAKPQELPSERCEVSSDIQQIGTKHVCLRVASLDKALQRLSNNGVEVAMDKDSAFIGGEFAFVKDPDGNLIELIELDGSREYFCKVSSEGLDDPTILNDLDLLKVEIAHKPEATTSKMWHQFFMKLDSDVVEKQVDLLAGQMKETWYSVVYSRSDAYFIFRNKFFHLERERPWKSDAYHEMRDYALAHGLEEAFLDFDERFTEYDSWAEEYA